MIHRTYRAASEWALLNSLLERGLFCLSPSTSRSTAKSLSWIFEQFKSDDGKRAVTEKAMSGLSSVYPSTRDICFKFLISKMEKLSPSISGKLQSWIWKVTAYSYANIQWKDGEAFIVPDADVDTMFAYLLGESDDNEGEAALRELNDLGGLNVSPERAWMALRYLRSNYDQLTHTSVAKLLSFDEALIRAEAVRYWLQMPRDDDQGILDRIFEEEHPSIARETLDAVTKAWKLYTSERSQLLLEGLRKQAQSKVMAAGMIDLLLSYNRDEREGERSWLVWSEILPLVLQVLPAEYPFNEARLYDVSERAIRKIPTSSYVKLCTCWVAGVERLAGRTIPSDYRLGVIRLLIDATRDLPVARGNLLERLTSIGDTGTSIRVLADLTDSWADLSIDERKALGDKIAKGGPDITWLQAAVLTRDAVPQELQLTILGQDLNLSEDAGSIMRKMDGDLLSACLSIYFGRPQPLWYIGTHHCGKAVWGDVATMVALIPEHSQFNAAWEDLTYPENGRAVAEVIKQLDPANAEAVFNVLIDIKLATNGGFMPEAWDVLLASVSDKAVKSEWIDRLASIGPIVLDSLGESVDWLKGENLKLFLRRFKGDVVLGQMLKAMNDDAGAFASQGMPEAVADVILNILRHGNVLMGSSYERSANVARKLGVKDPAFFKEVEELGRSRLAIRKIGNMRTEGQRPPNWRGPL